MQQDEHRAVGRAARGDPPADPRRFRRVHRRGRLWLAFALCAAALLYAAAAAAAQAPQPATADAAAAAAGTAASASAAAAGATLPPLVDPATAQHLPGKVIWLDLVTPDLARAEQFYSALFDWSFRAAPVGGRDYATALLDGEPVAGLIQRPPPPGRRRPVWLAFLSVSDVDTAKRAALSHGARLLGVIHDYPRRGRQAVFADPEGTVFAVLESSAGDPPDDLPDAGDWLWSALFARRPDREAAFYQAVLGYDVFGVDGGRGDGSEHLILSSGDYARLGVNQLSGGGGRRRAHWMNFVRVADVSTAAARAAALGGRVVVQPRTDRQGSRIAVIDDPSGAPVGLMQWAGGADNYPAGSGAGASASAAASTGGGASR